MSNQRSFKIESFLFAAFILKKIEYIHFWNKILDRNEMFSVSTQKFWSKSFCFVLLPKFFWDNKKFCFVFKKHWCNLKCFVLFWYHLLQMKKFCFDTWEAWSKQKRSELVEKLKSSSKKFRFVCSVA